MQAPSFEELDAEVASSIAELGGKIFAKLNWSSPKVVAENFSSSYSNTSFFFVLKDASWIALNNSLQCSVPTDIHLLLKSSDFILHDLTQPFKVTHIDVST